MGTTKPLTAPDGHQFAAYIAEPAGAPRGASHANDQYPSAPPEAGLVSPGPMLVTCS